MKVYATLLNANGDVILKEWTSTKAFQATEKWCDPKFINVAKTSDLEGYEFYPSNSGFGIVYTPDQIQSKVLLYRKFHELRARGAIR